MMKLFPRPTWAQGAAMLTLAAALSMAATIEWSPLSAADKVQMYVLEHRASNQTNWTRVEIAGTTNRVTIPDSAFGRWFRVAGVNATGQGEWSDPVKLPEKIAGLKLILEITP